MRQTLALLLLAAIPVHAYATGFSPADLAAAAQKASASSTTQQVTQAQIEAAQALRLGLALTPEATLAALSEQEREIINAAFGPLDTKRTFQVAWLMSGLMLRPETSADAATNSEVSFYHPLSQTWVSMGWASVDGTLRLSRLSTRQTNPEGLWLTANSPYLASLVTATGQARLAKATPCQPAACFDAVDPWIVGLGNWVLDPDKTTVSSTILTNIKVGRFTQNGADERLIASLPKEVRATFGPVSTISAPDGKRLILGSAIYPNLLIAADLDARQRPKLRSLTLVNLANVQTILSTGEVQ